jgi:hypothetical protein
MTIALRVEGEITEDGQLVVEIPGDLPHGRVLVTLEPVGEDSLQLTEADLRGAGQTAAEIATAPEIGSWATGGDGPSGAEYVDSVRRAQPRYTW